ncbi:hypothetical protein BCON_0111g00100 [Botryotinia convoluta]|uniref:RING-type domain-containing protein n=1 Tax=Botryotinia convoluta TaxID=54673 RepID=A0A4Z1IBU5_9HELO|nr:hypothetical protein BCON_0111g00100 [Botryotinia convoluta]
MVYRSRLPRSLIAYARKADMMSEGFEEISKDTAGYGSHFPGDMGLGHLLMLPDLADGDHPPHSPNGNFILYGMPQNSPFATVFIYMQFRERRLYQSATQVIPIEDDDGPTAEILAANSEAEDNTICPICREGYSNAQPSASFIPNCGHSFHLGCMVQLINSNYNEMRDRCICCCRKYTRILSHLYGEVTPPQNGEYFWRNDNGPLINEVFPGLASMSPLNSHEETPSPYSPLNDNRSHSTTAAELSRAFPIGEYAPIETNDGTARHFEVLPGQGARNDQAESQD